MGKEKFHKTHHWDFCNNVPLLLSEATPGLGGDTRLGQKLKPKYTAYPKGDGSDEPSWAAFDKQVSREIGRNAVLNVSNILSRFEMITVPSLCLFFFILIACSF